MGKSDAQEAIERELYADSRVASWQWEQRGSGHKGCRIVLTNGQRGLVVTSATASDHRAIKNMISDIRKCIFTAWNRQ